jgi:hypothetical protein
MISFHFQINNFSFHPGCVVCFLLQRGGGGRLLLLFFDHDNRPFVLFVGFHFKTTQTKRNADARV